MRGPDGGTSDNPGCFLDIVPESRIAFTSMLTGGWRPQAPWMGFTAIITMADDDAGSRYEARVMHPDAATRERHEALGFFEGWNTASRSSTNSRPHCAEPSATACGHCMPPFARLDS